MLKMNGFYYEICGVRVENEEQFESLECGTWVRKHCK